MRLHEVASIRLQRLLEFGAPAAQPAPGQPPPGAPPAPADPQMAPPPAAPAPPPPDPDDGEKKIDPMLMSKLKDQPYVTDFRHDNNSKVHPDKIASMGMKELEQLKTLARVHAQKKEFSTRVGLYDNDEYAFYQALINFVNKCIEYKKGSHLH